MLFLLLLSLSLLVVIDGPLRFGLTRLHFAVLKQKVGIAEPESLHAATDIPCSLMPCDVVFIAAVVAAFDFLWAGSARCGRGCVRGCNLMEQLLLKLVGVACCRYCC